MIYNFITDYPAAFYSILAAVILLTLFIILLIIKKKKKKKEPKIEIDESYINELIKSFGGTKNIQFIELDGIRLKVQVKDLKLVSLEDVKSKSTSGVFVTGNTIKTLFSYDSTLLKKAIFDSMKGGQSND